MLLYSICLLFEYVEYSSNALLPSLHLMDVIHHLGHLDTLLICCTTRASANSLYRERNNVTASTYM